MGNSPNRTLKLLTRSSYSHTLVDCNNLINTFRLDDTRECAIILQVDWRAVLQQACPIFVKLASDRIVENALLATEKISESEKEKHFKQIKIAAYASIFASCTAKYTETEFVIKRIHGKKMLWLLFLIFIYYVSRINSRREHRLFYFLYFY